MPNDDILISKGTKQNTLPSCKNSCICNPIIFIISISNYAILQHSIIFRFCLCKCAFANVENKCSYFYKSFWVLRTYGWITFVYIFNCCQWRLSFTTRFHYKITRISFFVYMICQTLALCAIRHVCFISIQNSHHIYFLSILFIENDNNLLC